MIIISTLALFSILSIPFVSGLNVADVIDSLLASESSFLDPISNYATTYQSLAKSAAVAILRADSSTTKIRNFYALACIYYATNGVENPRTQVAIPGCPVPTWATDDWLSGTNYCTWHGITCGDGGDNVVWVVLTQNNLHGSWPAEAVLLKQHLQRIDVSDNKLHYSNDTKWLSQMGELRHLSFGSTSWEYPGVSLDLQGTAKLVTLNISNSRWNNGPLRPQAFNTLKNLESLDMGGNQYNTTGLNGFLLTNLPKLQALYLENCRFTPNRFDLSFLVGLPSLVTVSLDFTRFEGRIPTGIGKLPSLKTFSCSYCDLVAGIPNELGNLLNLESLRLVANKLTGTIPEKFGRLLLLKALYLEQNNLDSDAVFPQAVCGLQKLKNFGVDCSLNCTCCTCCGLDCGNLVDPTPAPTPEPTIRATTPPSPFPSTEIPTMAPQTSPPSPTPSPNPPRGPVAIVPVQFGVSPTAPPTGIPSVICFAGDAEVEVQHKGIVKMKNLILGDMVRVAGDKYESVYSFGHRNDSSISRFLQIDIDIHNTSPLYVSPDHMLFVKEGHAVPASMIEPGDSLLLASNNLVVVKMVRLVRRRGAYAPFTKSGALIVNGIVASNYIAFQNSDYLMISGYKTPLSFHWIAHTFQSAQRLAFTAVPCVEGYTESGVSIWVDMPQRAGSWLLERHPLIIVLILLPCMAIFGFLSILECLCERPFVMTLGIVLATMLFRFKDTLRHAFAIKQTIQYR